MAISLSKIVFNPEYLANKGHYERHRAWLKSTPDALGEYVVKTYLENKDADGSEYYTERIELLDTDNPIHSLLTIHQSEITKDSPSWTGLEKPQAQIILKDIDGKRTPVEKFIKDLSWQQLWAGFIPVETFAPPKSGPRKIDAMLSGERSYSRIYEPDDCVAWDFFDDDGPMRGLLQYVVFRNKVVNVDKAKGYKSHQLYKILWIDKPGEKYKTTIVRSKTTLGQIADADYVDVVPVPELGEEKTGGLQFLPVTFFGDPCEGVHNTCLFRASFDARIKLNKQSHYDTTTRYNHFPRHIITGDLPNQIENAEMGSTRLAVLRGKDIDLHSLEAADPVALWRDIQRLEQSIIRKMMLMPTQINPESREQQSVESKRADQEARKKFYSDVTDEIQHGLEYLFGRVHAGFENGHIPKGEVQCTFPKDFDLVDPDSLLQIDVANRLLAKTMGKAGTEYLKRVFIGVIRGTEIPTLEGEKEDQVKKDLEEALLAEDLSLVPSDLANAMNRRQKGDAAAQLDPKTGKPAADPGPQGTTPNGDIIQDLALNGAQIASLLSIVQQLVAGEIPEETAVAMIKAAFPALSDEIVSKIINPLRRFKPPVVEPKAAPVPFAQAQSVSPAAGKKGKPAKGGKGKPFGKG